MLRCFIGQVECQGKFWTPIESLEKIEQRWKLFNQWASFIFSFIFHNLPFHPQAVLVHPA